MENPSFANIRATVKKALKAQGKTYRDLAQELKMSESGIKKSLAGDDCSISKLNSICRALELKLSEVIKQAEAALPPPLRLTDTQEAFFTKNPEYFRFYRELTHFDDDPNAVMKVHRLDRYSVDRYLAKLENLDLVRKHRGKWRSANQDHRGLNMRKDLGEIVMRQIHRNFLAHAQDRFPKGKGSEEQTMGFATFWLDSKQLSDLNDELKQILNKYADLSREQKSFLNPKEAMDIGALTITAPLDDVRLVEVPRLQRGNH